MSGMTISIVTISGNSALYFSTACKPFSASPTISKPLLLNIFLIIIRMTTASSTINTFLPAIMILRLLTLRSVLRPHIAPVIRAHHPAARAAVSW
jgi:hypothetical protein